MAIIQASTVLSLAEKVCQSKQILLLSSKLLVSNVIAIHIALLLIEVIVVHCAVFVSP